MYLIGGLTIVCGAMLALGVYISPKDELEKSAVIVAVSGGDTISRTREAVDLYKAGWAPRLIFSGAAKDPDSKSNAEAMRDYAVGRGVSPDVITLEEESGNTRENATRSAALVEALEYESVILVTSPYHQRRTYIEFSSQLNDEIKIINHPATDEQWSRRAWWRSPFGWYITASEAPKVLYALTQS